MISAEHISRNFGPTIALDDVSFTASDGEVVGLLGPNGAGKTTMIRILTGLLSPSRGRVYVDDTALETDPIQVKKKIGYLPENNPLYSDMRVYDYVRFVAEAKGVPRNKTASQTEQAIKECGLLGWEHRTIGKLSKGYRQRVGLAQAVVNDPAFVILDEPTSGLDPGQIVEFRNLIRDMRGKRTVLLSTHILSDASAICDKLIILKKGKIAAADTVAELAKRMRPLSEWLLIVEGPKSKVEEAFRNIPDLSGLQIERGRSDADWKITARTEKGLDPRKEFIACIHTHGFKLLELSPEKISLEDIFLGLMTEGAE